MIEINSYGGRIGRFWWQNGDLHFGRCGWDEAWPGEDSMRLQAALVLLGYIQETIR